MEAVTFPQQEIITFLNNNFIPLRLAADLQPYCDDYKVTWTPTLLVLGPDKTEHHRSVGFLEGDEFQANALLGAGKYYFDNNKFTEALAQLEQVSHFNCNETTAEALFLRGVTQYKLNNDPQFLKETYELLLKEYPDSQWTKKAYPYRLL